MMETMIPPQVGMRLRTKKREKRPKKEGPNKKRKRKTEAIKKGERPKQKK